MATVTVQVNKYLVQIGFESSGGAGGDKSRGVIVCYGQDGYIFLIYLAAPGSNMAPPRYNQNRKIGSINVPVDEMSHYVDILRNEKPVYLYMNSENPQWNHIRTSKEPVGEEEF